MELLKNLEGLTPDEQITAVVELQKKAMAHLEEQKQATIGKSAELVIQGLKKIKADFEAKFDSLNYDIQTKVASLKDGEQGIQGPKGDHGDRGLDGASGRDGRDGKDGRDGVDGINGVGVQNAKIDFDGSLVITLTDGREINCGEVVSVDVAKQIQKVTHNIQTGAGGDSQTVLDAIAALQATIATYGTMATQNANNVAITGGNINNTVIGGTTPAAGTFTTLTATGQTSLGGAAGAEGLRVVTSAGSNDWVQINGSNFGRPVIRSAASSGNSSLGLSSQGTGAVQIYTNTTAQEQVRVSHTASAVNYVQVTGGATGANPTISTQGSDANRGLTLSTKGTHDIILTTGGTAGWIRGQISSASGEYFRAQSSSATPVNYTLLTGTATGISPSFSVAGSDTNISQVFQSKGTGAIDLAAGSSGVNISNGGTVTAITRTALGSYVTSPSVAISAPTTAGGVQATGTSVIQNNSATIAGGGTGYTVGDTITMVGGTLQTGGAGTFRVASVSGGVITAVDTPNFAQYSTPPANPVSVTGGTGSGATLTVSYIFGYVVITNAGSGYVEQPTVTFSGGGGSGASAYAHVGGATVLRTLASPLSFYVPGGEAFRVSDSGATSTAYWNAFSGTTTPILRAVGSASGVVETSSAVPIQLRTNSGTEQLRVTHTASAVNYVQVTGAATTLSPYITAQGSDSAVSINLASKGAGSVFFRTSGTTIQFQVADVASAVNYLRAQGNIASNAPSLSAQGSDTNIDLALTPKGTGLVQFGTYTAGAPTATGYISIKASNGTTYKVLVGT